MMLRDDTPDDCPPALPVVTLTPGQYATRIAYRIDPLLAARVEIVQPVRPSRWNGEVDASELWQDRARPLFPHFPPPLAHQRRDV